MTELLDNKDYVNLGATDLLSKAAELIKKREEEIDNEKLQMRFKKG